MFMRWMLMKIKKEILKDYAVIIVVVILGLLLLVMKNNVSDSVKGELKNITPSNYFGV